MKKLILTAVLCLGAAAPSFAAPNPAPRVPLVGDWKLVYSAEFDGKNSDLDADWVSQNGPSGHILCSRWRENVTIENGVLRLLNKKENRGGQEWTSGNIWSRRKFQYGYFEARYKYGAATGLNNSFWLMTQDGKGAGGQFEIDINEGHYPNEVNTNIHRWSGQHAAKSHAYRMKTPPLNLSDEFHTYGLLWNEKELIWYFDGKELRRSDNEWCHRAAPVWLSSAIIKWAGEVTDKIDGTSMDVDYVRVFQLDAAGKPEIKAAAKVAPKFADNQTLMQNLDFQKLIQPIPATARFVDPDYFIWCGSAVKGEDGKYHLYYSRWLKKFGFQAWVTHSEIAHAVSDTPFGPFKHSDVTLPARGKEFWDGLCTHNPTIQKFGGKYYLYYMGNTGDGVNMKGLNWTHRNNQRIGVAVADSPDGPWTRFDKPIIAPTPGFFDALCCANPSVAARPGGGYLMVYKAVGDKNALPFGGPVLHCVATSDSPTGPFEKHPEPVFKKEGVAFAAEDPFIWSQNGGYLAIVKDNAGHFTGVGKSLALFQSADGFKWELAPHPLVSKIEVTWQDGTLQKLNSLERPQLLFENGVPVALLCAADEDSKREFSYNLQIPLAH